MESDQDQGEESSAEDYSFWPSGMEIISRATGLDPEGLSNLVRALQRTHRDRDLPLPPPRPERPLQPPPPPEDSMATPPATPPAPTTSASSSRRFQFQVQSLLGDSSSNPGGNAIIQEDILSQRLHSQLSQSVDPFHARTFEEIAQEELGTQTPPPTSSNSNKTPVTKTKKRVHFSEDVKSELSSLSSSSFSDDDSEDEERSHPPRRRRPLFSIVSQPTLMEGDRLIDGKRGHKKKIRSHTQPLSTDLDTVLLSNPFAQGLPPTEEGEQEEDRSASEVVRKETLSCVVRLQTLHLEPVSSEDEEN